MLKGLRRKQPCDPLSFHAVVSSLSHLLAEFLRLSDECLSETVHKSRQAFFRHRLRKNTVAQKMFELAGQNCFIRKGQFFCQLSLLNVLASWDGMIAFVTGDWPRYFFPGIRCTG